MGQHEEIQRLPCPACGAQVLITTYGAYQASLHDRRQDPQRFERPEKATCPVCKTRFTYYLVKPGN